MSSTCKSGNYDVGDVLRVTATYTSPEGSLTNPTSVVLEVTDPSGNITTPTVSNPSIGSFNSTFEITEAGNWQYQWISTGSAQAAEAAYIVASSNVVPAGYEGYSNRQNIENIYGKYNVNKWADVDNEDNNAMIASRINWAIQQADAEIDAALIDSPYEIPFNAPFDPVITDASARLAGVLLYESRGITDAGTNDEHELEVHRKMFKMTIRRLLAGQIALSTVRRSFFYSPGNIIPDGS